MLGQPHTGTRGEGHAAKPFGTFPTIHCSNSCFSYIYSSRFFFIYVSQSDRQTDKHTDIFIVDPCGMPSVASFGPQCLVLEVPLNIIIYVI